MLASHWSGSANARVNCRISNVETVVLTHVHACTFHLANIDCTPRWTQSQRSTRLAARNARLPGRVHWRCANMIIVLKMVTGFSPPLLELQRSPTSTLPSSHSATPQIMYVLSYASVPRLEEHGTLPHGRSTSIVASDRSTPPMYSAVTLRSAMTLIFRVREMSSEPSSHAPADQPDATDLSPSRLAS